MEGTDTSFFPGGGFDPQSADDYAAEFTNTLENTSPNLIPAACANTSYISLPPLNINSNVMTVTMWINPNEAQSHVNGLLYCRAGNLPAGFGWGNAAAYGLGYNWGDNAATYNYELRLGAFQRGMVVRGLDYNADQRHDIPLATNHQLLIVNQVTNGF